MVQNISSSDQADHVSAGSQIGFMLDLARCIENRGYYRRFIDVAAERGCNTLLLHFTDDQGCALQFDSIPELATPHAYSKAEMRELIAYASKQGVEIVPELASLGHARYITRLPKYKHLDEADAHFTGMCPVSDETRSLFAKLIQEVAELFPSHSLHVGLDEVNIGGHPLTREAMKTRSRGDLLADYVEFIHGVVTRCGKRMWMWGDGILQLPELMQRVPRDVVVCNWQYTPDAAPQTTKTLLDAGFDLILFSALISHDQTLFPGERFALPNVQTLDSHRNFKGRGKILGHLCTIWTPVRYVADSLWPAIDWAAAVMRGESAEPLDAARQFANQHHGLSAESADAYADVVAMLYARSPLRGEWLRVAKLQPLTGAQRDQVSLAAEEWTEASQRLIAIADDVSQNEDDFQALQLLTDLLAHTYNAAAIAADGAELAELSRLIWDGEELVRRASADWDRSRFADDARKYVAPIASFQDDHLIPLLQGQLDGLRNLRNVLKTPPTAGTVAASRG